jgi:hypothetical protein
MFQTFIAPLTTFAGSIEAESRHWPKGHLPVVPSVDLSPNQQNTEDEPATVELKPTQDE